MRPLVLVWLCIWAGPCVWAGAAPAAERRRGPEAAGCRGTVAQDAIAALTAQGDIRLVGGGLVKLLDVRLPGGETARAKPLAWLASLEGSAVEVASPAGEGPDRWGRLAASLTLREGAIDVAELLVAEGFALVSVEERDGLCRADLLGLESRARAAGRGLWSDPGEAPLQAGDLPALEKRVGQFALVEGRVRSVGERAQRTYLNFGAFGQPGFTLTVPKRVWSGLRAAGVTADTLRGRQVRVRGILEAWRGVAMEIAVPSMLEVLDATHSGP